MLACSLAGKVGELEAVEVWVVCKAVQEGNLCSERQVSEEVVEVLCQEGPGCHVVDGKVVKKPLLLSLG